MKPAYLLIGGNIGDRLVFLGEACRKMEQNGIAITRKSSIYETAAWGKTDQADFLNQAIHIDTPCSPIEAINIINQIEHVLGRKRTEHWGQRTIDIDILLYEQEVMHSARLVIPHPELQHRRFALIPLSAIAADLLHPVLNKAIGQLLLDCPDKLEVFLHEDS
jgi:2-amino-4-hydroxy-6-hydroxymethyldihydropteridine diphosphokinase